MPCLPNSDHGALAAVTEYSLVDKTQAGYLIARPNAWEWLEHDLITIIVKGHF
jgi:hypothetical protein